MSSEETDTDAGGWRERVPWIRIGLGIIGIYFGAYLYPPVLNGFGLLFDSVFGVVDAVLPFYAVVSVLAVVTGVYSAGLHRVVGSDTSAFEESDTERMKELHEKRLEAERSGEESELEEVYAEQGEVLQEEFESLQAQLQPFVWVLVGSMPVFIWVYWKVSSGFIAAGEQEVILPLVGAVVWDATLVVVDVWIVWYIAWSLTANQLAQRVLRVVQES